MTETDESVLAQLRSIADAWRVAVDAEVRLRVQRDIAITAAVGLGVPYRTIAERAQLSPGRIAQIMGEQAHGD